MLKLYSKAISAKTEKEIDETAQEIRNYLLSVQRTHFARDKPHFSLTYPTMLVNQNTIAFHSVGKTHTPNATAALLYILVSTLYNTTETTKDDRSFFLASLTINFFFPTTIVPSILKSLSVPESKIPNFSLVALSGIQVFSYQHIFKTINSNSLDLISRYVSVTVINFLQRFIIEKTRNLNQFLRLIINFSVQLITASLVQKISTVGIMQLITDTVESVLNFYIEEEEMERLPDDVDFEIPSSIECNICHSLLVKPVVVSNNFYCKECMDMWLRERDLDPMSGLPINHDEIKRNIPMEKLVKNYYNIIVKKLEENH